MLGINECMKQYYGRYCLPPMSIVQTEKIFSASVLAQTLPKPTLVKLLKVKYREAMQALRSEGPPTVLFKQGLSKRLPNSCSQPDRKKETTVKLHVMAKNPYDNYFFIYCDCDCIDTHFAYNIVAFKCIHLSMIKKIYFFFFLHSTIVKLQY